MDPFQVLGLSHPCTIEEAREAYYDLALRWHPDEAGPAGAGKIRDLHTALEAVATILRERKDRKKAKDRPDRSSKAQAQENEQIGARPKSQLRARRKYKPESTSRQDPPRKKFRPTAHDHERISPHPDPQEEELQRKDLEHEENGAVREKDADHVQLDRNYNEARDGEEVRHDTLDSNNDTACDTVVQSVESAEPGGSNPKQALDIWSHCVQLSLNIRCRVAWTHDVPFPETPDRIGAYHNFREIMQRFESYVFKFEPNRLSQDGPDVSGLSRSRTQAFDETRERLLREVYDQWQAGKDMVFLWHHLGVLRAYLLTFKRKHSHLLDDRLWDQLNEVTFREVTAGTGVLDLIKYPGQYQLMSSTFNGHRSSEASASLAVYRGKDGWK